MRRCRQGLLGSLTAILAGQPLPPLPEAPSQPNVPDFSELLPYRPMPLEEAGDETAPLQYRGERVSNTPQGWIIERGALQSQDLLLLADLIRYEPVSGMLEAEGHIRLEGQGIRLRCERLKMDWRKRTGEAWALQLEVEPEWTLQSDRVAFASLKEWDFEKVDVSSCPQEKPGWSVTLSRLKLNLDKFATFWNAKLFVGPVPVMYLPWATYPAKAKRSSGLLPTLPSYSSTFGLTLGLPYFQALGDTMDFTLHPEFHTKENPLWGGEFRWSPEPTHIGSVAGQYIHQRTDGEYRYRYQFKDLWQREDGWQFTADINQASDSLMEADYGHSVGNLGAPSFDSSVYIGKNFPRASFSVAASEQRSFFSSTDDPYYAVTFPSSLRKQSLPELQSRMYPIQWGAFYLDAGARLNRFSYRLEFNEDNPTSVYTWNREDAFARIQGRLGQWGPFRADVQGLARFTHYSASLRGPLYDPQSAVSGTALSASASPFLVDGDAINRSIGSAQLQLSGPPLGRTFEHFSLFGYKGEVKHVLEPFAALTATSGRSVEARVPRFDDVDSRPGVDGSAMGEQSLEFGVMQHLFGRRGKGEIFADLVRWKVSTKYHFQPILLSDGRFKEGWASLDSEFDAEPHRRIRVSFRSSSDIEENGTDNSLSVNVSTERGSSFSLALFSAGINRFLVRQRGVQIGGLQRLWDDRLRVEFHVNHNYDRVVSAQAAVAYLTPCLATSVRYTHLDLDTSSSISKEDRVDFVISLRNLGDFTLFSP